MNPQLRLIKTADIEQQLAKLEQRLAKADRDVDDHKQVPGDLAELS